MLRNTPSKHSFTPLLWKPSPRKGAGVILLVFPAKIILCSSPPDQFLPSRRGGPLCPGPPGVGEGRTRGDNQSGRSRSCRVSEPGLRARSQSEMSLRTGFRSERRYTAPVQPRLRMFFARSIANAAVHLLIRRPVRTHSGFGHRDTSFNFKC